jgi:hypothetical protein
VVEYKPMHETDNFFLIGFGCATALVFFMATVFNIAELHLTWIGLSMIFFGWFVVIKFVSKKTYWVKVNE